MQAKIKIFPFFEYYISNFVKACFHKLGVFYYAHIETENKQKAKSFDVLRLKFVDKPVLLMKS